MMRIEAMYVSPVKSLALQAIDGARLEKAGIVGDRGFFLVDDRARLFTQRECPSLVQIRPTYDAANDVLTLAFPDGRVVEEQVAPGQPVVSSFFGERPVPGRVLSGGWSFALSRYCGADVHLVKADAAGTTFDGYPISMCSTGSLAALASAAGTPHVDRRRFRQNIYFTSSAPHVEDTWIGATVRVGQALVRMKMADSRCIITTKDPESGEADMDTLKIIAAYRTDQPKEVNFGVYATVVEPGNASIGDEVAPEAVKQSA